MLLAAHLLAAPPFQCHAWLPEFGSSDCPTATAGLNHFTATAGLGYGDAVDKPAQYLQELKRFY